eukprot:1152295-Pelagomonas_calceolata.AAC.3
MLIDAHGILGRLLVFPPCSHGSPDRVSLDCTRGGTNNCYHSQTGAGNLQRDGSAGQKDQAMFGGRMPPWHRPIPILRPILKASRKLRGKVTNVVQPCSLSPSISITTSFWDAINPYDLFLQPYEFRFYHLMPFSIFAVMKDWLACASARAHKHTS